MSCHRLLHSITGTRTVADGTDTSTKADRARATTGHRAEPPDPRGRLPRRSWPRSRAERV